MHATAGGGPTPRSRRAVGFGLVALALLALWLFTRRNEEGGAETRVQPGSSTQANSSGALDDVRSPVRRPEPELKGGAAASRSLAGPVRISVLGRGDVPIPGVAVKVEVEGDSSQPVRTTDAAGAAHFPMLPRNGSVTVGFSVGQRAALGSEPDSGSGAATRVALGRQTVTGPQLVFRAHGIYVLTLRVVDAETSQPVATARDLKCSSGWVSQDPLRPGRFFALLQPDELALLHLQVEPPAGWSAWDSTDVAFRVSPYADHLDIVYPVRRAFDALVTPALNGAGVAGTEIDVLSIAGRRLTRRQVEADPYDRLHVRGLPHLRHEPMQLRIVHRSRRLRGVGTFTLPEAPARDLALPIKLKAHFFDDPGPATPGSWMIEGRKLLLPASQPTQGPAAKVRVSVRSRSGAPLVSARVGMNNATAKTGADGSVTFQDVPPGVQVLTVRQAGVVALLERLTIGPGEEQEFSLRESLGGTIRVLVIDAEGRPLPYASLQVRQASLGTWVDLDGRIQRIDTFVDHRGERLLRNLQCGQVRLIATWGSRRGEAMVELGPGGGSSSVRLVLPRSK